MAPVMKWVVAENTESLHALFPLIHFKGRSSSGTSEYLWVCVSVGSDAKAGQAQGSFNGGIVHDLHLLHLATVNKQVQS